MNEIEYLQKLIPKQTLSLICGKLLGDGNISIQERRNPRFRFQHCIADKEWCVYCYDCLKDYIPLAPPKYKYANDPRLRNGFSESFVVQSRTSEIFIILKELWYKGRKKVLPIELIKNNLNEESIAWWYQDDGCLIADNGVPRKVILSTESFSTEENKAFIKLLSEKLSITFSLDGQNRLCLYNQLQIYFFLHLIDPYIHSSMNRKKLQTQNLVTATIQDRKRTTIYLPANKKIEKPSEIIRDAINHLSERDLIRLTQKSLIKQRNTPTKGYQVVLRKEQFAKLILIKSQTGLSISQIVQFAISHRG